MGNNDFSQPSAGFLDSKHLFLGFSESCEPLVLLCVSMGLHCLGSCTCVLNDVLVRQQLLDIIGICLVHGHFDARDDSGHPVQPEVGSFLCRKVLAKPIPFPRPSQSPKKCSPRSGECISVGLLCRKEIDIHVVLESY